MKRSLKECIPAYVPMMQKKGVCEAFIEDIKEGDIFWCISLEDGGCIDVKRQEDAEIIYRLVRIEKLLKRL